MLLVSKNNPLQKKKHIRSEKTLNIMGNNTIFAGLKWWM
jgi:hypothetical protein